MKAVNLLPGDARKRSSGTSLSASLPTYLLLGVLGIGVLFVTLYVLTNNTISTRKAQVITLTAEVAQAQAQSERLSNYAQFATLAQSRAGAVRGLASSRFDWHAALADLSKVVPANTSLQTLNGSTTGATGSSGTTSAATASANGPSGPAFELTGCTNSQDDVARLMSRLRLINGVTSVTLTSSQKAEAGQTGASVSTPGSSSSSSSASTGQGCGSNAPTFDLKVLFQPLPAGGDGATGSGAPTSSTGSSSSSTAGGSK